MAVDVKPYAGFLSLRIFPRVLSFASWFIKGLANLGFKFELIAVGMLEVMIDLVLSVLIHHASKEALGRWRLQGGYKAQIQALHALVMT